MAFPVLAKYRYSANAAERVRVTLRKAFLSCLAAGGLLVFAGCAGTRFGVDGIKNKRVAEQKVSYVIRSANPDVEENSAEFRRAAEYVKTALSSKGFYEAPPGAPVDMVVDVDYYMGTPKTDVITYHDTWEKFVPAKYETRETMDEKGRVVSRETVLVSPEHYEEVAGPEKSLTITVYPKNLRLTARESTETADEHPPREVWSVIVTNEDRNGDLEAYVPLLVAAAMDKINEDTRGEIRVVLKPQDERVKFVKNGM